MVTGKRIPLPWNSVRPTRRSAVCLLAYGEPSVPVAWIRFQPASLCRSTLCVSDHLAVASTGKSTDDRFDVLPMPLWTTPEQTPCH